MSTAKRIEWIDVAKGLGLFLVVVGHAMTTPIRDASFLCYAIYTAIYFFHMPFMFYLSGRTFGMAEKRYASMNTGVFIGKKAKQLLVPYVVYGIIVYLIFALANSVPKLNQILEDAGYGKQSIFAWGYGTLIGDNLYAYHLWFIYGLFLATIFSYLMGKYIKNSKWVLFIIAILFLVIRVYVNTSYWGIANLVMKCYLWFVVGTYFDFSKVVGKLWSILWQVFSLIYLFFIASNINGWNGYSGTLLYEMIKWIADVGLLILFVNLALWLKGLVKGFFSYTGKRSYGIYLFHQPFFASGGGLVLYKVMGIPLIITVPFTILMCYLFPVLFLKLLDTKYGKDLKPYLLGTPRKERG